MPQVKKRLQQSATLRRTDAGDAGADGSTGGTYRCVPPAALANAAGPAPLLSPAQLRTLEEARLVVADDVVPAAAVAGAADEFAFLVRHGLLQADPEDLCNPLQVIATECH